MSRSGRGATVIWQRSLGEAAMSTTEGRSHPSGAVQATPGLWHTNLQDYDLSRRTRDDPGRRRRRAGLAVDVALPSGRGDHLRPGGVAGVPRSMASRRTWARPVRPDRPGRGGARRCAMSAAAMASNSPCASPRRQAAAHPARLSALPSHTRSLLSCGGEDSNSRRAP